LRSIEALDYQAAPPLTFIM